MKQQVIKKMRIVEAIVDSFRYEPRGDTRMTNEEVDAMVKKIRWPRRRAFGVQVQEASEANRRSHAKQTLLEALKLMKAKRRKRKTGDKRK
jgi:hypothetical protein